MAGFVGMKKERIGKEVEKILFARGSRAFFIQPYGLRRDKIQQFSPPLQSCLSENSWTEKLVC